MNELFELKYNELLTEFNRYILLHPEFLAAAPDEAMFILVDENDADFTKFSYQRAEALRVHDDLPNRPIIYVNVGNLAPLRSRLINPQLLMAPPNIAGILASQQEPYRRVQSSQ